MISVYFPKSLIYSHFMKACRKTTISDLLPNVPIDREPRPSIQMFSYYLAVSEECDTESPLLSTLHTKYAQDKAVLNVWQSLYIELYLHNPRFPFRICQTG